VTAATDLEAESAQGPGGLSRPSAWRRLRTRLQEDRFVGWVASLAITALAFLLRIYHLGTPHAFEFDETYYAKDAWSLLHFGYARNYATTANDQILAGHTTNQWESSPEMIVHPEVGKWLIALGEKLWGMDPFGWRIAACVVGSLMILLMIRFVRRVTGSMLLGCIAGLLLCFDGLQFVLSRLSLLDIFLAFFVLAAVHCMVADRQHFRRRLAARVPSPITGRGWGPVRGLLLRPWLLAAGVCWGLAIGTKWEGAYPLAGFGLLYLAWCVGARRSVGVRRSWPKAILADGVPAFLHLVLVAAIVYTATWTGWLMHAKQYETSLGSTQYTHFTGTGHCQGQNFIADNPDNSKQWPTRTQPDKRGVGGIVQNLEDLWYYHRDVYTFHTNFLNCATHSYASKPSGWLLLNRPVSVAAENGIKPGQQGCAAPQGDTCLRQVVLLGTPVLWWGGCVAAIAALILWIGARDWRFGVAIVGIATTWLTWLPYATRPIFSYYAIVTLPFLVLAVALCIGKLLSRSDPGRRTLGVIVSGAFFVLVLVNFAWFWPVYTNGLLTHSEWLDRIWFKRWI
jgi:dolichyl-phosphate-mannose-protein mannosyltransferase